VAFTRVFVGVSESLAGLQALRYAVAEARRRDSALHVVRSWQCSAPWRGYEAEAYRVDLAVAADETLINAFDVAMGGVPRDLTVVLLTVEAPAGPALVAAANLDDDLLIVGASRRRWRIRRSVGDYCARRAACPVVVVPAPQLARQSTRALYRQLHRSVREGVSHPL